MGVKNQVLYVPICVIKEIYRAKKTLGGINDAAKVFPDQELLMVMIGLIKGNGSGFMKPVTSKECLVAAILMVIDKSGYLPSVIGSDMLYLGIVTVFLMVKLSSVLAEPIDPFAPLEATLASVAFGGLWAAEEEKEEKTE